MSAPDGRRTHADDRPCLRKIRTVVALIGVVASVSVGGVVAAQGAAAVTPAVRSSTSAHPNVVGVKPIIRGLIDRQGAPARAMLPYVHAYVVGVNWSALQTRAGGPITAHNAIDAAIARVRQPDYAARGMVLKLRVYAGLGAPLWAKRLGGAPIPYSETGAASGRHGTIGRFWSTPFENEWAAFQRRLAARYDSVPEIREVTVSGCTTIFDEPFVRQPGVRANVVRLAAAGYTGRADRGCIRSAIAAQNAWRHTVSDLDLSPFPNALNPKTPHDAIFPAQMMRYCRATLGVRCALMNYALSDDKLRNQNFAHLYRQIAAAGSPIAFQTAALVRLGNPAHVLAAAVRMGTNSVELPRGYEHWSPALLASMARGLRANRAG